VESVQVVDAPVSASSLAERGLAGMIIIQPDTLVARIQFIEGFWPGTADSTVEISASISVDGKEGRLLGTSASGTATLSSRHPPAATAQPPSAWPPKRR
jgi:hypothetical protein